MTMRIFVLLFAALTTTSTIACSKTTIKGPESDKNFDDPDDPGTGGLPGAKDATTVPDDGGDSGIIIAPCDDSGTDAANACVTPPDAGLDAATD